MFKIEKEFKKSLERVSRIKVDGQAFLECFYEKFIGCSNEIAAFFKDTDMVRQRKMLEKSIVELLRFFSEKEVTKPLQEIGRKHSRSELGVTPELYDKWVECLMETVKEFDEEFNAKVELSWRVVLAPGITYMKFAYDHDNLMEKEAPHG